MKKINEEQANNEWVKLYSVFEKLGLNNFYDMDKLKEELLISPCTTTEDAGTAYKGALLVHINLLIGMARRYANMVSGTFEINEDSLLKICCIMHLAKRHMFIENPNEWEVKNRNVLFKFTDLEGCLKCGERSVLEAMNNGVKLTPTELEAIKSYDYKEDYVKNGNKNILSVIITQANEMAYAVEKERYKKQNNNNQN